jgi:hypothetical protein
MRKGIAGELSLGANTIVTRLQRIIEKSKVLSTFEQ